MRSLIHAFVRAWAYCLHPRVIALSILPLLLIVALALALGYFFWDPTLEWVRLQLESMALLEAMWQGLQTAGWGHLKTVLVPLIVIFAVTPLLVVLVLFMVTTAMTPALVRMVALRRFPGLEVRGASPFWRGALYSLGSFGMSLLAFVASVPLWLIPPLVLCLPPLIWGWLVSRVMVYDTLALHATEDERRQLMKRHWGWFLLMGVITGYLGALPGLVWASGSFFAAAFIILVPLAIWAYTLTFTFSSLWFTHYALGALSRLRVAQTSSAQTHSDQALSATALEST
jgi:Etoposide-induced protein 2.4 (EI24)